jgi:hypothetical protein
MPIRKKHTRRYSRVQRRRRTQTRKQRGSASLNAIPVTKFYFKVYVYDTTGNIVNLNQNVNLAQDIAEHLQSVKAPNGEFGNQFYNVVYNYNGTNDQIFSVRFRDKYHHLPIGLTPQCNSFVQLTDEQSQLMFEEELYELDPFCIAYESNSNNVNMA